MSIESNKLMNLADGKVLYDDLRERIDGKYTKPANGIPATDIADGVIPDPEDLIDDTAGTGDTDKTWSADKLDSEFSAQNSAINVSQPTATSEDIGKFLKLKAIGQDGNPTEFEYGEGGGVLPDDLPTDETAIDILHSLELECECLELIYNGWIAERESA